MAEDGFGAVSTASSLTTARWRTVVLNGSDQYLYSSTFGSPLADFNGDFTIGCWVWIDTLGDMVVFDASDGSTEYIRLSVTTSGEVEFEQVDGSGTYTLTTGTVLAAKQWHFICARRDGTDLEIIHDTTTYATPLTLSNDAVVDRVGFGAETFSPTNYFGGYLSRGFVFDEAVSDLNLGVIASDRLGGWNTFPDHTWFTADLSIIQDDSWPNIRGDQGSTGGWTLSNVPNLDSASVRLEYSKSYGSTNLNNDFGYDWGFGDPTPVTIVTYYGDTGFGSPYFAIEGDNIQILAPLGKFGDDGGYTVRVLGDWPIKGPYRFRLISSGGTEYPATTYAHSTVPGQSYRCFVAQSGVDEMRFALPVAPPGLYDLRIEWGDNFGQYISLSDKIEIITRNRGKEVYAVRRKLPNTYKTGPRTMRSEEVL